MMFYDELKNAVIEVKNEPREDIKQRLIANTNCSEDDQTFIRHAVEEQRRNCNDALTWYDEFHELCLEYPDYALNNTAECIGAYCNTGDPFAWKRG